MWKKSKLKEIKRIRKIRDDFYKSTNYGKRRRILLSMPNVESVTTMGGWTFRSEMTLNDGSEYFESGDFALSKLMDVAYMLWVSDILKK